MAKGETSSRNKFSRRDDLLLTKYIAIYNPEPTGRTGNVLYRTLCDDNNARRWPWASEHPWSSWQNRYKTRKDEFDHAILMYQEKKRREARLQAEATTFPRYTGTGSRSRPDTRPDTADGPRRDPSQSSFMSLTQSQKKVRRQEEEEESQDREIVIMQSQRERSAPMLSKDKGKAKATQPLSSHSEEDVARDALPEDKWPATVESRGLRLSSKRTAQAGPSRASQPSPPQHTGTARPLPKDHEVEEPRVVEPQLNDYRGDVFDEGESEPEQGGVAHSDTQDTPVPQVGKRSTRDREASFTYSTMDRSLRRVSPQEPQDSGDHRLEASQDSNLQPPPPSFQSAYVVTSTQPLPHTEKSDLVPVSSQLPEWSASQLHPGAISRARPLTQEPTPPTSRSETDLEHKGEPDRYKTFTPSQSPSPPQHPVHRQGRPPQLKEGPFSSALTDRQGRDRINKSGMRSGSFASRPDMSPTSKDVPRSQGVNPAVQLGVNVSIAPSSALGVIGDKALNSTHDSVPASSAAQGKKLDAPHKNMRVDVPQPTDIFSQPPRDLSPAYLASSSCTGQEPFAAYLPMSQLPGLPLTAPQPTSIFSQLPVDDQVLASVITHHHQDEQRTEWGPGREDLARFLSPTVAESAPGLPGVRPRVAEERGFDLRDTGVVGDTEQGDEVFDELVDHTPEVVVQNEVINVESDSDAASESSEDLYDPPMKKAKSRGVALPNHPREPVPLLNARPQASMNGIQHQVHNTEVAPVGDGLAPPSPTTKIGPFRAPKEPFHPPRRALEEEPTLEPTPVPAPVASTSKVRLPRVSDESSAAPGRHARLSSSLLPDRHSNASSFSANIMAESSRIEQPTGLKRRRSSVTPEDSPASGPQRKRARFSLANPALQAKRNSSMTSNMSRRIAPLPSNYVPRNPGRVRLSRPSARVAYATGLDMLIHTMAVNSGFSKDTIWRLVNQLGDFHAVDAALIKMRRAAEEVCNLELETMPETRAPFVLGDVEPEVDDLDNEDMIDVDDATEDPYDGGSFIVDDGPPPIPLRPPQWLLQLPRGFDLSTREPDVKGKGKARASAPLSRRHSRVSTDYGLEYTPASIEPADVPSYTPVMGLRAAEVSHLTGLGRVETAHFLEQRRVSRGGTASPAKSSRLHESFTRDDVFSHDHDTGSPSRSGGHSRSLLADDSREYEQPRDHENASEDSGEVNQTLEADVSRATTPNASAQPTLSQFTYVDEAASSPPATPPSPPMLLSQESMAEEEEEGEESAEEDQPGEEDAEEEEEGEEEREREEEEEQEGNNTQTPNGWRLSRLWGR